MRRRELERKLRIAGCYLKREGGSHSLWINPRTGIIEAIPRHTEIKEPLARKILNVFGDRPRFFNHPGDAVVESTRK